MSTEQTTPLPTPYQKRLASNRAWKDRNRERLKVWQKAHNQKVMENPELHARKIIQNRESYQRNKDKCISYDRARDPVKTRARSRVRNLIYEGRWVRQPCEVCGEPHSHAHHEDYSKPEEVKWLCPKHHKEVHNGSDTPRTDEVVRPFIGNMESSNLRERDALLDHARQLERELATERTRADAAVDGWQKSRSISDECRARADALEKELKRGKAHGTEVQLGKCPECDSWSVTYDMMACLKCQWSADKDKQRADSLEYMGNLLAIVHCDGGHYRAQHGDKKATDDAIEIVSQLKQRADAAEEANRLLREQINTLTELSVATMHIAEEPRELWDNNSCPSCPTIEAVKLLRNNHDNAERELAELKERLQRAEQDSKRLDWWKMNADATITHNRHGHVFLMRGEKVLGQGQHIRQAIDAALAQLSEPKK